MGVYTQYTLTKKQKVFVVYRCSKCGEINITLQELVSQESYTDRGTWTKKGLAKKENRAREELDINSKELLKKAKGNIAIGDYKELNLKGVCSKCHHKEPWSKIILPFLDGVCILGGMFAFINFLLSFNGGGIGAALLAVAGFLPLLLRYVRIIVCEKAITAIPNENLPKVFFDAYDLKKYLKKLGIIYEDDSTQPADDEKTVPVAEKANEAPKAEPKEKIFSTYDEKIGKNYKIPPHAKMEAVGKVSHYTFNGKAKLNYIDDRLHVYRIDDSKEVTTIDFGKLSNVENYKTLLGKPFFRFVTTSNEAIEITLDKNDNMAEEFSKIFT